MRDGKTNKHPSNESTEKDAAWTKYEITIAKGAPMRNWERTKIGEHCSTKPMNGSRTTTSLRDWGIVTTEEMY